jgi:hypothetical protein
MWNWFNCYLSGRHEYGIWCEPGAVFLRCVHCGRRSPGWALGGKTPAISTPRAKIIVERNAAAGGSPTRVLPFGRRVAS